MDVDQAAGHGADWPPLVTEIDHRRAARTTENHPQASTLLSALQGCVCVNGLLKLQRTSAREIDDAGQRAEVEIRSIMDAIAVADGSLASEAELASLSIRCAALLRKHQEVGVAQAALLTGGRSTAGPKRENGPVPLW